MTRFEYPEEDRTATLGCAEVRELAYCCAIYDNITSIQWQVYREMIAPYRFVIEGGGYNYEALDSTMQSVFNFIVNEDKCEHEFCFDFIRYRYQKSEDIKTFNSNEWLAVFEDWQGWIERGRKDE